MLKPQFIGGLFVAALLAVSVSPVQAETSAEDARSLARLYSAAFDRLPKTGGLNFWVDSFESGRSIQSIAADFSNSDEFRDKYGPLSDRAFIEQLFRNVLGREGVQNGIDFWTERLEAGRSRGEILAAFADSPENVTKTLPLFAVMQIDSEGEWDFASYLESSLITAVLNGPVMGARVAITTAQAPGELLVSTNTASEDFVKAANNWVELQPDQQLALLGRAGVLVEDTESSLFLVTASGGVDADNDRNLVPDVKPVAVEGRWRALMSADQLRAGGFVSPLTEAVYLNLGPALQTMGPATLLAELNALAKAVITDVNADGVVDYADVVAWNPLDGAGALRVESADLERLALALQQGRDQGTLTSLAARVIDGPAQVSLEDTFTLKRSPDGSCEGRGAVVTSFGQETITTKPPTSVCGDEDTGSVEVAQGESVGVMRPGPDGIPETVTVDCAKFSLSGAGSAVSVKLELKCQGLNETSTTEVSDTSSGKAQRIQDKFAILKAAKNQGAGSTGRDSGRSIYGYRATGGVSMSTDIDQFDVSLADAIGYGALATSWSSCLIYDVLAQRRAAGEGVPDLALEWAVGGCSSALDEVDLWVEEAPAALVESFEKAVPTVELEGCVDCYSHIASPAMGAIVAPGQSVQFTGVGPANSPGQRWLLGDGTVVAGWAVEHSYSAPGSYQARFEVDYANGSQGAQTVDIKVEESVGLCEQPPVVTASYRESPILIGAIEFIRETVTFGDLCTEVQYEWEQISGEPAFFVHYDYCVEDDICGDGIYPNRQVTEDTVLSYRVTVWDSDGNQASDILTVPIPAGSVPASYTLDNGVGDVNGWGCPVTEGPNAPDSTITWANRFNLIPGLEIVDEVLVAVGNPLDESSMVGRQISVAVYEGQYDGQLPILVPDHGSPVATGQATITTSGGDGYNLVEIPDTQISSDFFFVVASVSYPGSLQMYPGRQDTNPPLVDSYVKRSCGGNDLDWMNLYHTESGTNFMLRANAYHAN